MISNLKRAAGWFITGTFLLIFGSSAAAYAQSYPWYDTVMTSNASTNAPKNTRSCATRKPSDMNTVTAMVCTSTSGKNAVS